MIYSVHSAPGVPGVEKMERYVAARKLRRQSRYQLTLEELRVLKELSRESAVAALCLAFEWPGQGLAGRQGGGSICG